jgi:hypothetical protein
MLSGAAVMTALGRLHSRRLRDIYRSAGWPSQDLVEIELLAAGMVERIEDGDGHATLRVTDAGIAHLARTLAGNRAAFSAHHALEARVACEMQRAGRIVWRGLCLRAQVPGDRTAAGKESAASGREHGAISQTVQPEGESDPGFFTAALSREEELEASYHWCLAKPDVYSIRNTSVEEYVHPVVHEIKVRRADLLGDLRKPAKRAAYLDMASECWYVLGQDGRGRAIADPSEIPLECGVLVQEGERLQVARPAPRRAMTLRFGVWMALAKATPLRAEDADAQGILVPCDDASFASRNPEVSGASD